MPRLTILVALALAVALGACGGSDDAASGDFASVLEQVEGLQGTDRQDRLRELAREEGNELKLYITLAADDVGLKVGKAFERRFGIKTSTFVAGGEDTGRRISQEHKAGRRGADVADIGGVEMLTLLDEGAIEPYESPARSELDPAAHRKGWTASRFQTFVAAWNTELVAPGEAPRKLEELADPRWRGKVAIEVGDAEWYKTLREHWIETEGKSEEEADRIFEGIVRNSRVAPSHSVMSELLGAGDFHVGASSFLYQARAQAEKGAPVAYEPVAMPVIARTNGVGLVSGAEHPAAAVLFADWILSEGQELLARNHVEPTKKGLFELDVPKVLVDLEAYQAESEEWRERYDELLRGAEHIEE